MNLSGQQYPDVSILFSTYNRAEQLRKTLSAMETVDRTGINTEIVIVDNNSSDNTKAVIESFSDSLPIRYLFEPRAGKNVALNHALNTVQLGEIVVFCDDDIYPERNWLQEVVNSTQRRPQYSVFGGSIHLVWPETRVPEWAHCPRIHGWAFTRHDDVADQDSPYPAAGHPAGPNFWVRRSVFDAGRRYDESIGPKAGGVFFMGSETSFLFQLARDGYPAIHIPQAKVGHQVQPELLTVDSIKKRARRHGGGFYHLRPLPRQRLLQKHPLIWQFIQMLAVIKWFLYYVLASFSISPDRRLLKQLVGIRWLAATKESFNVAKKQSSQSEPRDADISVQFVPYWSGNPYQNQLGEHLAANGVRMQQGASLKTAFNGYLRDRQRFDILHIHWLPAVVNPYIVSFVRAMIFMLRVWILRYYGVNVIWTVHNIKTHEGRLLLLDRWIRRRIAAMADALITHSHSAKQQIVSQWRLQDPAKVFVVPHGNYIDCYQNTLDQTEARKQLNIPEDQHVVLFFGGVRPYKGLGELIGSFKAADNKNSLLLIAGSPVNASFADQIHEMIAGVDNIQWDRGYIDDDRIQIYMNACDVVAFPYRQVFSSGAVLLAMSFGRACIVPSEGTMHDVLDTAGAFFYDSHTPEALQNALSQAAAHHSRLLHMGQHNLTIARQWDWDSIARQTLSVYQQCRGGRPQSSSTSAAVTGRRIAERIPS